MDLTDLDFAYPDAAVATVPRRPTRVAFTGPGGGPVELDLKTLVDRFEPGDLLVLNDTRVVPARLTASPGLDILFVRESGPRLWEVLFPARGLPTGHRFTLPGDVAAELVVKGLPQTIKVEADLDAAYFARHGSFALPPYIESARAGADHRARDRDWYQTAWAERPGSIAAPTASLHFTREDLLRIETRGARTARLTLHVGPGTFLPIRTKSLDDHVMHGESVRIPREVAVEVGRTRDRGGRVWALGTTVTRALESLALGLLTEDEAGFGGETKLFIRPPYAYKSVDVLLTNFHQPKSTLLALVAAFAGLERVRHTYEWAIAKDFKLFSYGDLSAWTRN